MKHVNIRRMQYAVAFIGVLLIAAPAFADNIDIKQLQKDAENGDSAAQTDLAMAYHNGTGGLKSNDAEAVKWFRKAAEQGDLEGEYNLAIAYYHGFGVKKDMTAAVIWFKKAAEQGYADAEYILAAAYQNGVGGLPKDLVQSDLWLGLAEAQGNKDAENERIALEGTMTEDQVAQANLLIEAQKPKTSKPN